MRSSPYVFRFDGREDQVDYEPAESRTGLFGGNSNWRGPVWFPLNFLLIEALQRFHYYYGDSFKVECPTGSGNQATPLAGRRGVLAAPRPAVPARTSRAGGRRTADASIFATDPYWQRPGALLRVLPRRQRRGLGANHQTGWTGLVAKLLQQCGE